MSATMQRVEYHSINYDGVDEPLLDALLEMFGQHGMENLFYLPDRKYVVATLPKDEPLRDAILRFGDNNGWDCDYTVSW